MQRDFTAQWMEKGIPSEIAMSLVFANLYKLH